MELLKSSPQTESENQGFWNHTNQLLQMKLFDRAFFMLQQKLLQEPQDPQLRRSAAHALEAKAEYALQVAEQLGIKPDTNLLREYLEKAIQIDNNLAGPYWFLAVVYARFEGEYEAARICLDKAKIMGYNHQSMPFIGELITKGRAGKSIPPEKWKQHTQGEHELRLIIWRLALWPDISYFNTFSLITEDRLHKHNSFFQEDAVFTAYCRIVSKFIEWNIITKQDVKKCLDLSRLFSGESADTLSNMIRIVANFTHDRELSKKAVEAHIRILIQESLTMRTKDRKSKIWVERARNAARRAIEITEALPFEIEPELHSAMFLAYRHTFMQPLQVSPHSAGIRH